MSPLRGFG